MKNKIFKAYKNGIGWGITMFIAMNLIWPYLNDESITLQGIGIGFIAYGIIGSFLFGWATNLNLFKDKNLNSEEENSTKK